VTALRAQTLKEMATVGRRTTSVHLSAVPRCLVTEVTAACGLYQTPGLGLNSAVSHTSQAKTLRWHPNMATLLARELWICFTITRRQPPRIASNVGSVGHAAWWTSSFTRRRRRAAYFAVACAVTGRGSTLTFIAARVSPPVTSPPSAVPTNTYWPTAPHTFSLYGPFPSITRVYPASRASADLLPPTRR